MRHLSLAIVCGLALSVVGGKALNGISFPSAPATARAAAGVSVGAGDQTQSGGVRGEGKPLGATRELDGPARVASAGAASAKTGGPDRLLAALIAVESGGDPRAIGDGGRAVGVLQIHRILVADCNRIAPGEHFTLADRLSPERSVRMFEVYTEHYSHGATDEVKARRWCAGPTGDRKPCSISYWNKVRKAMEETR